MYYPYVRGRQYELLAMKELLITDLLSEKIVPIIEPVKLSPTFIKTLEAFIMSNRKLCIIINPSVGTFNTDMQDNDKAALREKFLELIEEDSIQKAYIVKKNSVAALKKWNIDYNTQNTDWIVINNNREYLSVYSEIYSHGECPLVSFIPDESIFRRSTRCNRGLLEDRFEKRSRNSDYADNYDELYSEDHLYYAEDGFKAFSDYSIVGSDYLEGGFAPYAVAIHIIYFDSKKALRVRHFVSNSNSDIQNPAGKFYEAITKLANWVVEFEIKPTTSLNVLLNHYKNQTYPGLGSVKKLSLMHHLELLATFLDNED